jgi:hypothetical protein
MIYRFYLKKTNFNKVSKVNWPICKDVLMTGHKRYWDIGYYTQKGNKQIKKYNWNEKD